MRRGLNIFIAALVLASFCPMAHASINKVTFDVFVHNDVNNTVPVTLRFSIVIADTSGLRPPDAVDWTKPFTVTIPTATAPTVYKVNLNDWEEWSDEFHPIINPATIGNTIPKGVYTLTLTDKAGRTFRSTNTLSSNTALPATTITQTPTATIPNIIRWNAVSGAQYYRIRLKDKDWGEPVYWYPKAKDVYVPTGAQPSFIFPAGVIRKGHNYRVQLEAKDSNMDLSKRSRSLWVDFVGP